MKPIMGVFLLAILLITSFPAVLPAESTDSKDNPWERFSLSLGGFITTLDSTVVLGAKELGIGLEINAEDALNLDSSLTVFRGDAFVRLGSSQRHRLDFSYYDLRRSATRTLTKDLEIGGNTYPIGTTVDSSLDFQIIKGGYSYSLLQDNRVDIALGLGMFVIPIDFEISAAGRRSTSESITAPLPFVHFRADIALTPKLFLRQTYEFFYIQVNSFQGSLFNGLIALEYNPWKYIGFGLGYNIFRVALKAEGSDYPNIDFTGKIQLNYGGLLLYARTWF
jgi:hypothetical protein